MANKESIVNIYVWTNNINGKQYVGQSKNLRNRKKQFYYSKRNYANEFINEDRRKYKKEDWSFKILKECYREESDYWEQYFIEKLNTKYPNGYNILDGGIGMFGYKHSDETKKKMSESASKRQIGENNHMYGKHWNNNQIESHKNTWKKVKRTDNNGTVDIWLSARLASEGTGLDHSSICKACNGKYGKNANFYKGYYWEYEK